MRLAIVAVCAACRYDPTPATPGPDDGPGDTSAADPDAVVDARPDAATAVRCTVPSPTGLLVCYQFDGNLATLDDSSSNNIDVTAVTGLSPITRTVNGVSSQAALVGSSVAAHIAQDPAIEITGDYTIVAWLMPINPSAGNDGILDHNAQCPSRTSRSPAGGRGPAFSSRRSRSQARCGSSAHAWSVEPRDACIGSTTPARR